VETLQRLQAKVASGDRAAQLSQTTQLRIISEAVATAGADLWKDDEEVVSLVIYLLGGGQPRDVVKVLQAGLVSKESEQLVRGALAYVAGQRADAAKRLEKVDARITDLRLAGQLAFIKSFLHGDDTQKALDDLDWARLLSPGTLVEEAALRREMLLVVERKDVARSAHLIHEYVNRFDRSPYAADFVRTFAALLANSNMAQDSAFFDRFDTSLRAMSADNRVNFLLTLSRTVLLQGNLAAAKRAADMTLAIDRISEKDKQRAILYRVGARLLGEDYDKAVADLASLSSAQLDRPDAVLKSAIGEVAIHLHDDSATNQDDPKASNGAPPSTPPMETIAQIESALKRPVPQDSANRPGDF
jgi:chemotaxis protein MotC